MTPEREKEILELDTRKKIYETVRKFSGSHFREIERMSGLSTGSVKYHLDYLVRNDLIILQKDGNNVRYFSQGFNPKNRILLSMLRQDSIRKILLLILAKENINHEQIVIKVDLSPSTVTWHLKKLEDAGIINARRQGRKTFFELMIDKREIINLLITYKESFFDVLVDNVIEMWDI